MASIIESIEYVELTWDDVLDGDVDLTAGQDDTQCIPFKSWELLTGSLANDWRELMHAVDIYDNGGTAAVRIIHTGAADTDNRGAGIFIVEFVAGINVQKVAWSIADSSTSTAVTLTDVTDQDSAFWINSYDFDHSIAIQAYDHSFVGSRFNGASTTELTLDKVNNNGPLAGWVYVVDCDSAEFIVEHTTIAVGTADTDSTTTISSTVLANTFVLADYSNSEAGDNPRDGCIVIDLEDSTTVRARRTLDEMVTPADTATVYCQIVEAQAGEFAVQRGTYVLTAVDGTDSFTAVTQANSIAKMGVPMHGNVCIGTSDLTSGGVVDGMSVRLSFDSSSTIIFDCSTVNESGRLIPWEVIDFTGSSASIAPHAMHYRKQMGVS